MTSESVDEVSKQDYERSVVRVGVTGSRGEPTPDQIRQVRHLLDSKVARSIINNETIEVHHGDCVGADVMVAEQSRLAKCKTVAHPGFDAQGEFPNRAWHDSDFILQPFPYLTRNRTIVGLADKMLAVPDSFVEVQRSGTWYTVRYAREQGVPVTIVWPDGSVTLNS